MEARQRPDPVGAPLQDKLAAQTGINAPQPLSGAVRERRLAPGAGVRHFVPRDEQVEAKLIEVEKLIRRGSYNAAIRTAGRVDLADADLASTYALILSEKVTRSRVALGDRHLARGNLDQAKRHYRAAGEARDGDAATRAVAGMTREVIGALGASREALAGRLKDMLVSMEYETWCETRSGIRGSSILDHVRFVPDVRLEDALGPRVPPRWPPRADPQGGWTDPAPIDELATERGIGGVVLDRPAVVPGFSFTATTAKPLTLQGLQEFAGKAGGRAQGALEARQLRASSAFPLMATMLAAHARVYALEHNLSLAGLSRGSMPVFRYSYLVEQARTRLAQIAELDGRMAPMQIELDDFAELIETIRRQVDEESAEIQALDTRISELQTTLTTLTAADGEIGKVVQQLKSAEDECDVEWWEVLVSVLVVIAATAVGAGIGFILGGPVGAVAGGVVALVTSIGLTIKVWSDRAITCDNVTQARQDFQSAQSALRAAVGDVGAELTHALLQRDATIAQLTSLQDSLDEAVTSNGTRVLNATTLSRILGVLDGVRRTSVLRAHSLARMAQDAYNAENDTTVNVVAASHGAYMDEDARGYTASAVLQRDLEGLEHIRLTGRTRKRMQLAQSVSLRQHYPSTFAAILVAGHGRFATRLEDFDRWFPGTYMQGLKEVRVEVLVDGGPRPIRGYLSNDGASYVRFADHGNTVRVDGRDVLAEPDAELRRLCYKRRRRHHAVETMAFPSYDSVLFDARATGEQEQERNFFEGCGLESTWHLELMPDQVLEYARVTDVVVHFQFDALFDPALKRVVEAGRYRDRNETAMISLRKLLEDQGEAVDFSKPLVARVTAFLFEAPFLDKTIRDVALMVRPKQLPVLAGVAKLRVGYQDQPSIEVETNEQGIVATADGRPAGTNTSGLRALTQGKSAAGVWSVEVVDLPAGFQAGDIQDLLLVVRYTFGEP